MNKFIFFPLALFLLPLCGFTQDLSQTIRGTVVDADNNLALIGATVLAINESTSVGTTTDLDGKFRLEQIPLGRINIQINYLGYKPIMLPNIVINSGKEVVLNIKLQESVVKMKEVVVSASKNKGEALNNMALLSARSISPEETNRYAGGFNDPSKILSNFAGITATQDGSNDIIVRGNSPKYIQWRLEGIQISNPNHFADQSAVGGAVSILNNNILGTSDFYTGAFAPEYGDALSGVYDVKLRNGNNEKTEAVFGFGLLGTDVTVEGPFKKGYGGSYVANYRYSTATLINEFGLLDFDGAIPKFQDGVFKVLLPSKKMGTFSLFGIGGKSSFSWEDVKPDIWNTPGDNFMREDITEDYSKSSYQLTSGLTHSITFGKKAYLKTTLAYSKEGINDDILENRFQRFFDSEGNFMRDSLISRTQNFKSRLTRNTYRAATTYNYKFNSRHKIQIGTKYALLDFNFNQSQLNADALERQTLVSLSKSISTLRNFVSWRFNVNDQLVLVSGFHNMNTLFNKQSTLEPRLGLHWNLKNRNAIHFGYGLHSNMESIHNYYAEVQNADGSSSQPNTNLGLLKANHFVLAYEQRFGKNIRAKVEAYYQGLYDLPVENLDTSYYSTINEGLEFRYVDLVNEGKGKNYGIEFTLEKFFSNSYYYLINASIYESKYTALDGVERNTRYNGNYLVNLLFGKEFTKLGKKKNQTLGLNAKVFFGGGQKVIPLLRDQQGNLAVDPDKGIFWDYDQAYENKIEDTYTIIVSASYKWDRPRATHELFLNLDNVTNNKGKISEYYDESEPNSIGYLAQFGFFPNLMYRVYF